MRKNLSLFLLGLLVPFTMALAASIKSITPGSSTQGQSSLTVTIYGSKTHFYQASSSISLVKGNTTIQANSLGLQNDSIAYANFSIPQSAPAGLYDLLLSNSIDGIISKLNGFTVTVASIPVTPTVSTIKSISPASATQGQSLNVTINGSNTHFNQASSSISIVKGSTTIQANSLSLKNDSIVYASFSIPQSAPTGLYDLLVNRTLDGVLSKINAFTVNASSNPIISSISPATAKKGQTLDVTITGVNTHFNQVSTAINLNFSTPFYQGSSTTNGSNISSNSVTKISDTSIQASFTIPNYAVEGLYAPSLYTPTDGTISLANGFTISGTYALPTITTISPTSSWQGQTLTVYISGNNTHFSQGSNTVSLSQGANTPIPASSVTKFSDTYIQANFSIPSNTNTGTYTLLVNNNLDGSLSMVGGFAINSASSSPRITKITPSSGKQGENLNVTVSGVNSVFSQASSTVNFTQGSNTITGFTSNAFSADTVIHVNISIPYDAQAGDYDFSLCGYSGQNPVLLKGFHVFADSLGDKIPPTRPDTIYNYSAPTANSIQVYWSPSSDNVKVTGYDVYVDGVLYGSTADQEAILTGGTNYKVTIPAATNLLIQGLLSSHAYSLTVKAKDKAGNLSDTSKALDFTTADNIPPSAPTNLQNSTPTENSFSVVWDASTDNYDNDIPEYQVYVNGQLYSSTVETKADFTSLTPSTLYNITVRAVDYSGNISIASAPLVVNTKYAPVQIAMVGISANNKNQVIWNKPITTEIDSFYIYRETDVSDNFEKIGKVAYNALNIFEDKLSFPEVQSNKYTIATHDKNGEESNQSSYHKTMHLSISKVNGTAWYLFWEPYEGFKVPTYKIYRGTTPNNLALIGSTSGSNSQYTDVNAPAGNLYYQLEVMVPLQVIVDSIPFLPTYAPQAKQNIQSSASSVTKSYNSIRSNIARFVITSLNASNNDISFEVYPNPSYGKVNLCIANSSNYRVVISNTLGQVVYSEKLLADKTSLDFSQFGNKGIYFLQITDNKGNVVGRKKVVVQ